MLRSGWKPVASSRTRCTTSLKFCSPSRRALTCHCTLAVLYSTCTGSTAAAARYIKEELGSLCSHPIDVSLVDDFSKLRHFTGYIVGCPTWNTGAKQQRSGTSWDDLLYNGAIEDLELQGKPFAIYGFGDAVRFKNNFADAISEVHDVLCSHKGIPLGYTDPSTYLMQHTKSLRNGMFLGLPLDNHNQPAFTLPRIQEWCRQLQFELQELQLEQGLQQMQQQIFEMQEIQLQRDLAGQTGGYTFRSSSSRGEEGTQSFFEGSAAANNSSSSSSGSWRQVTATTTTTESGDGSIGSNEQFNGNWRGSWREELESSSSSTSSDSSDKVMLWKHLIDPAAVTDAEDPEKALYIPDTPAAWARDGSFREEYPTGFIFTDRWYKLGDRWYRFADEGFVVTAGFREHTAYRYAYRDILRVEQMEQQQQLSQQQEVGPGREGEEQGRAEPCSRGGSSTGTDTVELWVTVKVTLPTGTATGIGGSRGSGSRSGGVRVQKTLILKDVEVCGRGDRVCTVMRFLKMKMEEAEEAAEMEGY